VRDETTEIAVFDVEPFGHELPSGLSLRVEDKAEWLRRNEEFSVYSKVVTGINHLKSILKSESRSQESE
jgi:hypothetical protein